MGNQQNINQNSSLFPGELVFFPPNRSIIVMSSLQLRDESQLYDADLSSGVQIFRQEFFIQKAGTLIRAGNELLFADRQTLIEFESQIQAAHVMVNELVKLTEIRPSAGGIDVINVAEKTIKSEQGSHINDLWITTQSLDNDKIEVLKNLIKGFKLSIGDQLKLGRIRLRVQEICLPDSPGQKKSIDDPVVDKYISVQGDFSSHPPCRFCLSISISPDSPLVKPCNCTGTVAYIHVSCLQEWFKNKIQPQKPNIEKGQPEVVNYTWKNLECELCKKQYTYYFEVDGVKYELFNMPKPEKPYLVLEQLTKDKNMLKGLFIINMNGHKQLKIVKKGITYIFKGRGQEINMRLLDISVSRIHSCISFHKGFFYLTDWNSKFGTLALIRDKITIPLAPGRFIFHSAQSRFNIQAKSKNQSILSCFGKSSDKVLSKRLDQQMDIINYTRQYLENIAQEQKSQRKGTLDSKQKSNTFALDSQLQYENTHRQRGNLKSFSNERQSQNISLDNQEFYFNNSFQHEKSQDIEVQRVQDQDNKKKTYDQFNKSFHFEKNEQFQKDEFFEQKSKIQKSVQKEEQKQSKQKQIHQDNTNIYFIKSQEDISKMQQEDVLSEQYLEKKRSQSEDLEQLNERQNSWELYIDNYRKSQYALDQFSNEEFKEEEQFQ